MVHKRPRWKWHECLQARVEPIDNDSECENDEYAKNTTYDRELSDEHHQMNSSLIENTNEDMFSKQKKLKEEAKVALILGAKMARMQVEIERQVLHKKKSSLYDNIGINTNDDKLLNIDVLEEMNNGQLQAIVNDLYYQIEANNDELVNLLIERDSLSMEQDSILVDIEDLTRRLQERAANLSKKLPSNDPKRCVYMAQQAVPKRSIFQNLLRKQCLFNLFV